MNLTKRIVCAATFVAVATCADLIAAGAAQADAQPPQPVIQPQLTSVTLTPVSKDDQSARVVLRGDRFDQTTKSNNLIVINGQARDVCWAGTTGCSATISGDVRGMHEIELLHIAPDDETAPFKVCHGQETTATCSGEKSDATSAFHRRVVVTSAAVVAIIAGFIALLVLIGRSAFVIWGERYLLSVLLVDKETDTYSLSKLQFYIWTTVAIFGYAYLMISRLSVQHWYELPAVPSGLPGIIGISAGAAVGAQVVTQINGPKGTGKLHPSLSDLITTGDVVAAERVQFLVWTLIGAAGFLAAVTKLDPRTIQALPDVPASILAISGISAFGYLGGKLARNGGPVINEVIIRTGPDPDIVSPGTPGTSPAPTPAGASTGQFGLIDLRGRNLSRDATFKISAKDASAPDIQLTFDHLQPAPADEKKVQRPRVVEKDLDANDETVAKRLLLVVQLDSLTSQFFVVGDSRVLTVTNPDSQKAVFKYTVPETQKPS